MARFPNSRAVSRDSRARLPWPGASRDPCCGPGSRRLASSSSRPRAVRIELRREPAGDGQRPFQLRRDLRRRHRHDPVRGVRGPRPRAQGLHGAFLDPARVSADRTPASRTPGTARGGRLFAPRRVSGSRPRAPATSRQRPRCTRVSSRSANEPCWSSRAPGSCPGISSRDARRVVSQPDEGRVRSRERVPIARPDEAGRGGDDLPLPVPLDVLRPRLHQGARRVAQCPVPERLIDHGAPATKSRRNPLRVVRAGPRHSHAPGCRPTSPVQRLG